MIYKRISALALMVLLMAWLGTAGAQRSNEQFADSAFAGMTWDEIVAEAAGQTVNMYMWGGSEVINSYVSGWAAEQLAAEYDITMNRVGVNDAAEVVNKVLGEAEAGQDEGTVDLIWINGENFRSMKQGGLLFCGYTDALPNMQYVNQDDPTIAFDFGTPVDGCEVPWNRAQFAMIYNEAFVDEPPRTMDALLQWVEDNPGRFAYPAPPDFTGSVFVRHVFYNEADKLFADEGGYEVLLGEFDQAIYDQVAAATWETLNAIEPFLWREGNTYPNDKTQLDQLFANTEIDFSLTYAPEEVGSAIENGLLPPTAMTYALDSGTIGNVNFVAIPYNAPNTAAAMVTANFLLSPEAQLHKAQPDVWGVRTVLDTNTLPEETAQAFAEVPRHPAVVSAEELTERGLPELQAAWLVAIEQGWVENVGEN